MIRWIAGVLMASLVSVAIAETPKEGEGGEAPKIVYVSLVPALVGNYGAGPKLQYYKADVALRVSGEAAAEQVERHEPLIRNQLIMLFAQQTDETMADLEGKERLRQQALQEIRQVLLQEEGSPLVDDLLFNNLVVQ